ncbi:hypothetical protein NMG60_11034170 [Bertholletia excelsa]
MALHSPVLSAASSRGGIWCRLFSHRTPTFRLSIAIERLLRILQTLRNSFIAKKVDMQFWLASSLRIDEDTREEQGTETEEIEISQTIEQEHSQVGPRSKIAGLHQV